jgi:hypothetical protein
MAHTVWAERRHWLAPLMLAAMVLLALGWARAEGAVAISGVTAPTSADLVAGKTDARYNIAFTTNLAATATEITVTFPAGYTVGGTATIQDAAGNAGKATLNGVHNVTVAGVTTVPASRQVRVHLVAPTALNGGNNVFRILTGVTNPPVSGTTGAIMVTTNAAGEVPAGTSVAITPGALTNTAVSLQSSNPGATGNLTVSLRTANPVAATGQIRFELPAGFQLNSGATTLVVADTIPGSVAISSSGQVVTVHRVGDGGTIAGGTNLSFTLSNVRNPLTNGNTGSFGLRTQTDVAIVVDQATISGVRIGATGKIGAQGAHKVTICHKGKVTISIAQAAWPAHEAIGSTMGACN